MGSISDDISKLNIESDEQSNSGNGAYEMSVQSDLPQPQIQTKREDYINWDEFFMGAALLAAQRSKDPVSQVGAVIVDEETKIIQGAGYNGFPRGCCDNVLPWSKGMANPLENKYLYVCHAEMNCILNRNAASSKNASIYVTLFPCNECCKLILQAGIKKVVYLRDKSEKVEMKASRLMFEMAGVELIKFSTDRKEIILKF